MRFEWDDRKYETNILKHGFDFIDAPRIFRLPMLVSLDDREDYGEEHCKAMGLLDGHVVVVVYTEPDNETIRIVSLRKALSYERKQYEKSIKNRLGKS